MLIRSERKLHDTRYQKLYVHLWDGLTGEHPVKVAYFRRMESGEWEPRPWEIGYTKQSKLDDPTVLYIQGKLRDNFLRSRGMRLDKSRARLIWRWESPHYSGQSGQNAVFQSRPVIQNQ